MGRFTFSTGLAVFATAVFLTVLGLWYVRSTSSYHEAKTLGAGNPDFKTLSARLKDLATEKGGAYAFEVLRRAALPAGTDLHLLGHVAGDELYKQEGTGGMAICTQDFRNACSHSIVIGTFNEFGGEQALDRVREACRSAPGGPGAYTMCYHGLGHGVFAFFGYELAPTVDVCRKTGTDAHGNREYHECVGGAIMELMGGGGHDRALWVRSQDKYLSKNDPLAPCDSSAVPNDVKSDCYIYITPHLFEYAGANLAAPQPIHFKEAFTYCDRIPRSEPEWRDACFGGVGKEFPVLALARDIRDIASATDAELRTMRSWCGLAPHAEAYNSCTVAILSSLYWGGENDPNLSIRFCSLAEESSERESCFGHLFGLARQYAPNGLAESQFCETMPEDQIEVCTKTLP